jgi:hypothetical protein
MLSTPATYFTHTTRHGTYPKSFQNAAFSCGIPLPDASGAYLLNSHPTANDVATITARLPNRKTSVDPCDRRTIPARYSVFIPT